MELLNQKVLFVGIALFLFVLCENLFPNEKASLTKKLTRSFKNIFLWLAQYWLNTNINFTNHDLCNDFKFT